MIDFQIIPAILTDSLVEAQKQLDLVKGLVERVQIDIVDEKFAANRTIKVEELEGANTSLIVDVQLMVNNPVEYLNRCDVVGVERVYGHVEQMSDQEEFVESAADLGMQVGLAVDIHTPVAAVIESLPYVDAVLLMAVEVGFGGQKFEKAVLGKVTDLRGHDFGGDICIDGGLDTEAIRLCREQGANHFAVGSTLWKAKNLRVTLEEMKGIG